MMAKRKPYDPMAIWERYQWSNPGSRNHEHVFIWLYDRKYHRLSDLHYTVWWGWTLNKTIHDLPKLLNLPKAKIDQALYDLGLLTKEQSERIERKRNNGKDKTDPQ